MFTLKQWIGQMPSDKEYQKLHLSQNEGVLKASFELGAYKLGYFLMRSKNKETLNEDVLFLSGSESAFTLGVCDGAGGHPLGQKAALSASEEIIKKTFKQSFSELNFLSIIESANEKILDLKAGARSTLAMLTLENDWVRFFNVGDSEVIYWNSVGREIYSNIPHSLVGYGVEAGLIDQNQSLDEPDRHIVTNLMGDAAIKIDATTKMELKAGHTIIIGSDGVFDNLTHEQLRPIALSSSFEDGFEQLSKLCEVQDKESWKKEDDTSFFLIRRLKT